MPSPLRRLRRAVCACVLATVAVAAQPGGGVTARASTIPYGAVEVFGQNWAGSYASWGDLNVYSNGDGNQDRQSTYGQQYECVEFAQRWAAVRFGEQPLWGGDAWVLWGDGPNLRVPLTQHPNGSEAPQFGDIMVFNRSATSSTGHVAVVAGVGAGYVLLAEQNWASSGLNRVPMDSPTHVPDRDGMPALGWLRGPTSSTPPPPPVTVTGASVPPTRRTAIVAQDTRLWTSIGSNGSMSSVGNSLSGSPALAAEPPTSSLGVGLVHYLAANADSHQLYTRTDSSAWTLASVGARCLDSPALAIGRAPGGLTATVACEGTDHAVWVSQTAFVPGSALTFNGAWSRPGGTTSSGPALELVAGQATVLVTGTDHHVWGWSSSTGWAAVAPGLACTAHPAVAVVGHLTWLACQGQADAALWYTTSTGGAWAQPRSAGGVVVDGPALSATPAGAVVDVEGTDGQVYEASLPLSGAPSSWAGQGWLVSFGPASVALPSLPIVVASTSTRNTLLAATPGSTPADLAGGLDAAPAVVAVPVADPTAAANPLYIAVAPDGTPQVRSAAAAWQPLGAPGTQCLSSPGALVTTRSGSATLTVACEGTDQALWYATGAIPSTGLPVLSGWRSLGGTLTSGPAVGLLGGTPTFVVTGLGRQLYWTTASGQWAPVQGWLCSGRPALAASGSVSYLACQGTDQAMWWATATGGALSSPQSSGGVLVDGPGLAAWDDEAIAFVEGSDGSIYQTRIAAGQAAAGWQYVPSTSAVGGVAATALG